LRNLRLILRLHYYLGTHILGASRGGPCDSTALVTNGVEDGQRLLTHTPSGMDRFDNFCDVIANRPICTEQYEIGMS